MNGTHPQHAALHSAHGHDLHVQQSRNIHSPMSSGIISGDVKNRQHQSGPGVVPKKPEIAGGMLIQAHKEVKTSVPVNHLILRVQAQYDTVFSSATIQKNIGNVSSQHIRIPRTYTDLGARLPKIHAIAEWSETVIRSMFDTLIPLGSTYPYKYGSPEGNIIRALEAEKMSGTKTLAFGLLLAELNELLELLPDLDLLPEHKKRIVEVVGKIRSIAE